MQKAPINGNVIKISRIEKDHKKEESGMVCGKAYDTAFFLLLGITKQADC
jgi:hypothetical protein